MHKTITANGIEFAYLEEGQGPLVLLLHGFPDTPQTWDHVRPALAKAGYRAVTPWTRGYHPTGAAPDGKYDADTLGRDALALIDALGGGQPAILIGHDWGAAASYTAAAQDDGSRIRFLVTLAIPHARALKPGLGFLWRARHFVRLKMPGAVSYLQRNNFAAIDTFIKRWSPAWTVPPHEADAVKACYAQGGSAAHAVAYYKQFALSPSKSLMAKVRVPAAVFLGESDPVLRDLRSDEVSRACFEKSLDSVYLPGGHWLHRESPDRFVAELLRVLPPPTS